MIGVCVCFTTWDDSAWWEGVFFCKVFFLVSVCGETFCLGFWGLVPGIGLAGVGICFSFFVSVFLHQGEGLRVCYRTGGLCKIIGMDVEFFFCRAFEVHVGGVCE